MGIKLIILLALVVGALYCLHLLAQDFQAIRLPRFLRIFKRDANNTKPHVRWKMILGNDPIQCAQLIYCELGTSEPNNVVREKLIYMLTLEPKIEDVSALHTFKETFNYGLKHKSVELCMRKHITCPFKTKLLYNLFDYILKHNL